MQEIKEYLENKKRSFDGGVKLYNKHGKVVVPGFSKYKNFFSEVNEDNKGFAQGLLDNKLGYIVRMAEQFIERSKKKTDSPKAIKTKEDLKAEDPNSGKKK